MKEIEFLVKGSAAKPYIVTFLLDGLNLSAYCTCTAGINGQYCKHRFGIIRGEEKGIISDNAADASIVASWLPGTDLKAAMDELAAAEQTHDPDKKALSAAKKKVARAMRS